MKLVTIELNIYYEEGIDTPIKSSVVGLISNTSKYFCCNNRSNIPDERICAF
jgi:hypothetical protein